MAAHDVGVSYTHACSYTVYFPSRRCKTLPAVPSRSESVQRSSRVGPGVGRRGGGRRHAGRSPALRPGRRRLRHVRRGRPSGSTTSRPRSGATSGRRSRTSHSGSTTRGDRSSPDGCRRWPSCRGTRPASAADGTRFPRPGRATIVLRRESADGPWLGVHTHFSLVPCAPRARMMTHDAAGDRTSAVIAEQCTGHGAQRGRLRGRPAGCPGRSRRAARGWQRVRRGRLRGARRDRAAAVRSAASAATSSPSSCGPARPRPEALLAVGGAPRGLAERRPSRLVERHRARRRSARPAAAAGYPALAAAGRLGARPPCRAGDRAGDRAASRGRTSTTASPSAASNCSGDGIPTARVYLPGGEPIAAGRAGRAARPRRRAGELRRATRRRSSTDRSATPSSATVAAHGGVLDADDFAAGRRRMDARAPTRRRCAAQCGRRLPRPTVRHCSPRSPTPQPGDDAVAACIAACSPRSSAATRTSSPTRRARRLSAPPTASGNVVVVVHSNSYPRFGSGIVVADYDLVLANRAGRGFTPEPGHPNFPVPAAGRPPPCTPGRCPMTTVARGSSAARPAATTRCRGTPSCCRGSSTVRRRPDRSVTATRWEWLPDDDGVRVEAGFDGRRRERCARGRRRVRQRQPLGAASAPSRSIAVPVARPGDRRRRRPANGRPRPRRLKPCDGADVSRSPRTGAIRHRSGDDPDIEATQAQGDDQRERRRHGHQEGGAQADDSPSGRSATPAAAPMPIWRER